MLNFKNPKNLFFILAASIFLAQTFLSAPDGQPPILESEGQTELLSIQSQTKNELSNANITLKEKQQAQKAELERLQGELRAAEKARTAASQEAAALAAEQRAEVEERAAADRARLETEAVQLKQRLAEIVESAVREKDAIRDAKAKIVEANQARDTAIAEAIDAEARIKSTLEKSKDIEELNILLEDEKQRLEGQIAQLERNSQESLALNIRLATQNLELAKRINYQLNNPEADPRDRTGDDSGAYGLFD